MPSDASFQDLRDLYYDYTGRYAGEFPMIEAFRELPVDWQSTDQELEGFIDFLDIFDWADIEPGHGKEYWDELIEAYEEYYGVTDEGIDWDLLRSAYAAANA